MSDLWRRKGLNQFLESMLCRYRFVFSSFETQGQRIDPTISMGIFEVEMYDWYGSAALPVYLEAADKIWKLKP